MFYEVSGYIIKDVVKNHLRTGAFIAWISAELSPVSEGRVGGANGFPVPNSQGLCTFCFRVG